MPARNGKAKEISLGDDFGDVVVKANGARIEISADGHIPTPEELNLNLYQNKDAGALKGTFNTSGSFPAGCYRSSTSIDDNGAWVKDFVDGDEWDSYAFIRMPVRLIW